MSQRTDHPLHPAGGSPGDSAGWWLSYDVSQDRSRDRVASILRAEAWRCQYSGFVAPPLAVAAVGDLLDRCQRLIGPADSVLGVPWCDRCAITTVGSGLETPPGLWVAM